MVLNEYEVAILKTLAYSDIFNFPLTKEEIWKFLTADAKIDGKSYENFLKKLMRNKITEISEYYCLKGRESIIQRRINNLGYLEEKLLIAKKAAFYLSIIPTVLFIGISGGLAMNDVEEEDDIDFFIITKKGSLFKTRLLALLILEIIGLRRKRLEKSPANKVCVNFLIDETRLSFPVERHDIYTSHEIIQIKPLFERNNMYSKFLGSNKWIVKFFPNLHVPDAKHFTNLKYKKIFKPIEYFINLLPLETPSRHFQISFMKKHISGETVTKHELVFNPNDYRVQTLNKLRLKLHELGLLTIN